LGDRDVGAVPHALDVALDGVVRDLDPCRRHGAASARFVIA
jgi:hypothetical protein